MEREVAQNLLAFCSQGKQHLTPILAGAMTFHVTARGQPVHQFDRAVMLNLQPLREFADPGARSSGQTLHRQHQLVLPRLEAGFPGGLLAEMKETADFVTQLRQRLIISQRQ
jgi:hypothetical protein